MGLEVLSSSKMLWLYMKGHALSEFFYWTLYKSLSWYMYFSSENSRVGFPWRPFSCRSRSRGQTVELVIPGVDFRTIAWLWASDGTSLGLSVTSSVKWGETEDTCDDEKRQNTKKYITPKIVEFNVLKGNKFTNVVNLFQNVFLCGLWIPILLVPSLTNEWN